MGGISFLSRVLPGMLNPPLKVKCNHADPLAVAKLSNAFQQHLLALNPELNRPVVVVAIGTDRSTGDSLGPLVGSKLADMPGNGLEVYGTLDDPVHAGNLSQKLEMIYAKYKNPVVIATDACLGQTENIGWITMATGPLKPGAGVNKSLPAVGDLYLTGTVNVSGYMEYFVLQNTRLSLVMKMSDRIAASIHFGFQKAQKIFEQGNQEVAPGLST